MRSARYSALLHWTSAALAAASLMPSGIAQSSPLAELPARFVPNLGQWSSPESFRAQVGGLQVFLEQRGFSCWLREQPDSGVPAGAQPSRGGHDFDTDTHPSRSVALRMGFVGARDAQLVPQKRLSGHSAYLVGEDATQHKSDVPGYAEVRYDGLYPGVGMLVREGAGRLEYDLSLEPGAELAQVEIDVEGADSVSLDDAGNLILTTALGPVVQPRPTAWVVDAKNGHTAVDCAFELRGPHRFGFTAPDRDIQLPLVVDPPIVYASYLGGFALDEPWGIQEDGTGRILVWGRTASSNFPVTTGALQTSNAGSEDGFILCLDPSQPPSSQLVFSTYFGGPLNDSVRSCALLQSGLIAFGGLTQSTGLPVTAGAAQPVFGGGIWDGFVGVLDSTGSSLFALSYLGASGNDAVDSISEGASGDLLVCGITTSTDLPVSPTAFQPTHHGGTTASQDGFIARLDTLATTMLYVTYFGGSGDEFAYTGGVDSTGLMCIFGATNSTDLPVTATAFDSTYNGGSATYWWASDTFVVLFDPTRPAGQELVYCSYFGGLGYDQAFYVHFLTGSNRLLISGTTTSTDLPVTADAYQPHHAGGSFINANYFAGDGFLAVIDPTVAGAAGLQKCTYFGSAGQDQGLDASSDSNGRLVQVGWTQNNAALFPTTPGGDRRVRGGNDGWIGYFSANMEQLLYGSLLGGTIGADGTWYVIRHADGQPIIAGGTGSTNFPVSANALQPAYGGVQDGILMQMNLEPIGSSRLGAPSRNSSGAPTIHVLGDATPGNAAFGFACSKARPNTAGLLLIGVNPAPGIPVLGVDLYVDLPTLVLSATLTSNPQGESSVTFTYPTSGSPILFAQYVWVDSTSPLTLSASDAARIN